MRAALLVTGSYAGAPLRFGHNFRNSPPIRYTCTAKEPHSEKPRLLRRVRRVAAPGGD